ncbi:SDR family NAD(P)-dependent oxidoreductase [Methylobacterium sp. J-090]|uniref:SDR family NAD(P)-dependent oxidoreductase n=1 Tax=Methylobacterium sp. J-090 TaxID=2836666 RepID=UPI001FBB9F62|nr:SDR family oxidoreductase [Methylobacterium sp. J-090]MCJ2084256.1 SDR family oxidoreductase [Methylobacterium sp. J-090]
MDLGISGRVAVVTGGDSGMGFKTAEFLLREGVKVVLTDIDDTQLQKAASELAAFGEVRAVAADLSGMKGVEVLAAFANMAFDDKPTILVCAAGITGASGDFLELTDDDWLEAIQTDLMAGVRATRAFIPHMRKAGWGRVVLFSSEDAVQPYVEELPYAAAKAGVLNLAKGLSKAYGPDGVLVNAVGPAFIATPMTDAQMEKKSKEKGITFDEAIQQTLDEERPGMVAKRRGKAEEVAAAVVFLCSERASFITGEFLRVDGGSVMTMGA